MRVDEYASIDVNKPVGQATEQTSLFTIKIVLGEGLAVEGSSRAPDAFVVLSDQDGNRYAKTRTMYDSHDPRWDETFDIPVRQTAWFMVTVRHRSLTGKHELLGRAYLRLDPAQYVDLISKDVLLPLNTKGHVLLRISMEGERDDIQFHFGRAFRWLKRTESDMVRMFVDKVGVSMCTNFLTADDAGPTPHAMPECHQIGPQAQLRRRIGLQRRSEDLKRCHRTYFRRVPERRQCGTR